MAQKVLLKEDFHTYREDAINDSQVSGMRLFIMASVTQGMVVGLYVAVKDSGRKLLLWPIRDSNRLQAGEENTIRDLGSPIAHSLSTSAHGNDGLHFVRYLRTDEIIVMSGQ